MTLPLHENRWVNVAVAVAIAISSVLLVFYLAGYFFLWHIKVSPLKATPLTVVRYWFAYGDRVDVTRALKVCMLIASALTILPLVLVALPKKRALHGEARFATLKEIKEAGLLEAKGIVLGTVLCGFLGLSKKYLMLDGQLGVLLAAPPRSGKGVGFVNPNMLNWNHSSVTLDIRGESWRVTSGYREKHGIKCFMFNPLAEDFKSCQWNPFTYVSHDPLLRINDLQKIANMLFPDPPPPADSFWASSGRTLFLGLALYVFETPELPKTFGEVVRQIMNVEGESAGEYWKKVIEERDKSEKPLSDECKRNMFDFIFTSGPTQSSIRKTFTAKLELWQNPIVDAATSADSFDLRDLRKKRISLYICVAPTDLERVQVILNLLFQQILEANMREMPEDNPELKYQLMLMMDEFTAMGRIPILASSVSYMGGFNIRLCIVIQSPSQLRSVYGADVAETIMTCMGAQIVFAPREQRHAEEISKSLGRIGQEAKSRTKSAGLSTASGSINLSEQGRDLLLPQEVKEIGKSKQIIFIENVKPIMSTKVRYFVDKIFKLRLLPPVKVSALDVRLVKSQQSPLSKKESVELRGDIVEKTESWREATIVTVDDMDTIDNLELRDFAGDFDKIEIPAGDPISDEEMKALSDVFLATLSD